jgi:monovalent cation:H+ antiporter, CPA1 family
MNPADVAASGETTLGLIRLFVLLVGAATLLTLVARRVNLPYTVAFVAFGLAAGTFESSLRFEITPQLVLVVLLPALIFEASYRTDFVHLRPVLPEVALLAGPGVLVTAAVIALALAAGAGLDPAQAFVVGAMLAATDPAAVIATFRRLASPPRLATIVESESVFNDGTGIVLFALAVDFVSRPVSPGPMVVTFAWVALASATIGGVGGFLASRLMRDVGDHVLEISLSVVLAYGTYLLADGFHLSGVIATAVAGIVLGSQARARRISDRTEDALDTVWEFLAFLATALVFLVVGFAIPPQSLEQSAGAIGLAFAAALVARALIVYGLLGGWRLLRSRIGGEVAVQRALRASAEPGASTEVRGKAMPSEARAATASSGERTLAALPIPDFSWLHVIFWSGLRGAVSTALALSLPVDFPNRTAAQGITFGVVLVTLLLQATTAEAVVGRWGRERSAAAEPALLAAARDLETRGVR